MLIQFQNMRGRPTLGGTSSQPSALRGGAISPRNPNSIQLRASCQPEVFHPVARSRDEETTVHPYSSSRDHGDAEFRDSVVFYVIGILFLTPLILAGIAVKFG